MKIVVHPNTAVWPENILRFHIVFDEPMDTERALSFINLIDSNGEKVSGAFVDLPNGLWTADQRVLTVLFHPGRVKSGLLSRAELGPAIRKGESYTIHISGSMREASGKPLGADSVFHFAAGLAVDTAIGHISFRTTMGSAERVDYIHIPFDRPIDWLSANSEITLRDENCQRIPFSVTYDGCAMTLQPLNPVHRGIASIEATSRLEDACGNRQAEPFEVTRLVAERGSIPHSAHVATG